MRGGACAAFRGTHISNMPAKIIQLRPKPAPAARQLEPPLLNYGDNALVAQMMAECPGMTWEEAVRELLASGM